MNQYVSDGLSATGAAKYGYQATRAARGLGTTTALTAGLDLASGTMGTTAAADTAETIKSLSTATKGTNGAARLTRFARISKWAGRVAPAIAKGTSVLGVALGGYQIGQGIGKIQEGKSEEGRDKIISGSADVVTSGALGVAAVASGSVVGIPVAAIALGVAGVSQGAKYAWKYREQIGEAASGVGKSVVGAAEWAGDKVGDVASNIGDSVSSGFSRLRGALFGPPRNQPAVSISSTA